MDGRARSSHSLRLAGNSSAQPLAGRQLPRPSWPSLRIRLGRLTHCQHVARFGGPVAPVLVGRVGPQQDAAAPNVFSSTAGAAAGAVPTGQHAARRGASLGQLHLVELADLDPFEHGRVHLRERIERPGRALFDQQARNLLVDRGLERRGQQALAVRRATGCSWPDRSGRRRRSSARCRPRPAARSCSA